jgi:hypothetical protein
MTGVSQPCNPHPDIVTFKQPLKNLTESLERRRKIKIVAIGSSSVAGEGVIPFPARLELALRSRYPGRMIDVINRGIGGQEAPEELTRFQDDVIAEDAALVVWQVGTNAIYRSLYEPSVVAGIVATGLSWLKGQPGPKQGGEDARDGIAACRCCTAGRGQPVSAVQADGAVGQRRHELGGSDQQERQSSHDRMVHSMRHDGT